MDVDVATVRRALEARNHRPASLRGDERFAAVAAVLREREGAAEVLLIRRTDQAGDPWSGHMAFPGGRSDPTDGSLLHTAVRETFEEVGLRLDPERDLIGRLDDLAAIARSHRFGLVIAPFVFTLRGDPSLSLNASEVAEVVWAPLAPMLRGDLDTTFPYALGPETIPLPAFDVEGRVVWGLTHRMLLELFDILDGKARTRDLPY